jgi:hypothetical protein
MLAVVIVTAVTRDSLISERPFSSNKVDARQAPKVIAVP